MRTILLGLLASFSLLAQGAEGDYSIAGTVVNSVTGEPVKGALVTLNGPVQGHGGYTISAAGSRTRIVRAGGGGEYQFGGLPQGRYFIRAERPGFVDHAVKPGETSDFTPSLDLSDSVSGRTVLLDPLGAIEGTIVNQYGDALGNVTVGLFQFFVWDGARLIRAVRTAVTNDRGRFRIWDLSPGKYFVKAMGRAGGTAAYVADSSVRYDSWEGFRPVYFGGAREMSAATALIIATGTQARADFTVEVEPTYKIRGVLQNREAYQPVSFELLAGDRNTAPIRVLLNAANGRFTVDDVPAGHYTLRATMGTLARGETAVDVQGQDADDISITLLGAVVVTAGVVGPDPDSGSATGESGPKTGTRSPRSCNVSLGEPEREPEVVLMAGSFANEESFSGSVFAGQYRVSIRCTGGYVVSAVSGGSDLLANPEITVQPGQPPIEINMKPGGSLRVKMTMPAAFGTGVLLVPAFSASAGPVSSFLAFDPIARPNSEVRLADLAPGDYVAYALAGLATLEYQSPEVLHSLTGGTSVHIEEGKEAEITLTGFASVAP